MSENAFNDSVKYHLTGMYQDWFLDYASYVILERAVPAIEDGLKPVQRRILHAMKCVDDGKMNKVANIVGQTMQYHPHGDASIGDALVQLGQKDLLIDCQGNWGNILTGDGAAAPRYIEARLSKFALDTVFNPKTTHWMLSYDGRKKEPIHLPIKFPLLLAQGVEGIAVGLNSKILPHNFCEICDAALAYLRGEEFVFFGGAALSEREVCCYLPEYLDGQTLTNIRRLIKVVETSDTPEELEKLHSYVEVELQQIDRRMKEAANKAVDARTKAKELQPELDKLVYARNRYKKNLWKR